MNNRWQRTNCLARSEHANNFGFDNEKRVIFALQLYVFLSLCINEHVVNMLKDPLIAKRLYWLANAIEMCTKQTHNVTLNSESNTCTSSVSDYTLKVLNPAFNMLNPAC